MLDVRKSFTALGVIRRDLLEGFGALRRIRSGTFRKDDADALGSKTGYEHLEGLQFRTRVRRGSIEEMIRESVADDVEARVDEKLLLQDVPRLHPCEMADDIGRYQRVSQARVT